MSDIPRPRTIAEKVEWLFTHLRDENHQPFTTAEIAKRSGVSFAQIRNLREGTSENPTLGTLEAICRAFGVTLKVFLDEDGIAQMEAKMALLATLERSEIRDLALRAGDLGPEAIVQLTQLIGKLLERESPPKPEPPPETA